MFPHNSRLRAKTLGSANDGVGQVPLQKQLQRQLWLRLQGQLQR
ncbi:hypothetical protein QN379_00650 [Glaciimonas sp. Gout2]|nr:hypothetical protein [Glaciimonas sp. Gout2]MEB0012286.1 hypothetical protein [Glaciimonas sp. Cout2]MEB0080526.1 hypothetical protein [Glaciimonas sp. Gout2]